MSQRSNYRTKKVRKHLSPKNRVINKSISTHPPPYLAQSIRSSQLRCLMTAAQTNLSVTFTQLAGLLGIVGTSATTSVFWTNAFRLKKIAIWGPVATAGTPVSVALTWTEANATFESPPSTKADTSVSFDFPAFVMTKPPQGSLVSKWHQSSQSDEAFALTVPNGATIDFWFDFVLPDFGAASAGPTIAGGTAGNFYHKIVNNITPNSVNAI
jgi:hypothetical protein